MATVEAALLAFAVAIGVMLMAPALMKALNVWLVAL